MEQDPQLVAKRAQLSADTLGEALNAFFARLNLATIGALSILLFGVVFFYNVACTMFSRNRGSHGPHPMYEREWAFQRLHYS